MLSETRTYIERLRALRADTLKALDGANARALNWKPTARDTNSLFVLATHLLGSERHWIHRVVGGRAVERDRDAEFRARGKDSANFRAQFDLVAQTSEEVLARLTDADLNAARDTPNYGTVTVRWAIVHLIEHFAEHVGQMNLTRQVWQAQKQKVQSRKRKAKNARTRKS